MKTMSQKAGLGLNFQKPQQQKNYDSNFSQQRRSANGYYATNATTKNLKVSLELLYHRKKKQPNISHTELNSAGETSSKLKIVILTL